MLPTTCFLESLLLIIFGSLTLPSSILSEPIQKDYSLCAPFEYRCGDEDYKIYYPFRLTSSPDYCGIKEFELTCTPDNKMLVGTISNKEYKVNSIDYDTQIFNVTDRDFVGQSCIQTFSNTSIHPLLFNYSRGYVNLAFFFHCSPPDPTSVLIRYPYNITCRGSDSYILYKLPNYPLGFDVWSICSSMAFVPIDSSVLNDLIADYVNDPDDVDKFMGTLKKGFNLNWKVGDGWCSKCTVSKGICWSDPYSQNSWEGCYCGNGTTSNNGICTLDKKSSRKNKKTIIIGAAVGVVGAAAILGFCLFLFLYIRRKRQQRVSLSNLVSQSSYSKRSSMKDTEFGEYSYNTHIFTYDELQEATSNFSESRELGDGGFGTVYKGKLRDGRTVAVKRLYEHNYCRLEQFRNEVDILSRLHHRNLVNLYGCTSGRSRDLLLVYEYVPNGTVADHLHGTLASKELLPWPIRMSIAIETADALAYLHAIEPPIIHRDVKTNNILLDNNFHVKVADFGLSRLFPLDATHVSTAPQGTPGYVDPEYHQCFQLTDKSDVYSFGVVLVELISSKPAVDISRRRHEINLANMAVTKIQNCQIDQLVDSELGYQSDLEITCMIDQVAELAFRCLQSDREMRPSIKEVLEVLGGIECGGKKAEKDQVKVSEVYTKEETQLLKNVIPFSPNTVTKQCPSMSTTPKKVEKDQVEVSEVYIKEETQLLKNVMPFSPDTVTEQWSSMSTTPNTSA